MSYRLIFKQFIIHLLGRLWRFQMFLSPAICFTSTRPYGEFHKVCCSLAFVYSPSILMSHKHILVVLRLNCKEWGSSAQINHCIFQTVKTNKSTDSMHTDTPQYRHGITEISCRGRKWQLSQWVGEVVCLWLISMFSSCACSFWQALNKWRWITRWMSVQRKKAALHSHLADEY